MNGYNLALVLHIVAILALFGGETLVLTSLGGARRAATVEAMREWTRLGAVMAWLTPLFAVLAFIPAAYMVSDRWSWKSHWINVAMLSLLVLLVLLLYPMLPRLVALGRRVKEAPAGAVPASLHGLAADPLLWLAGQLTTSIFTGIIVLMVFKPDTGPSLAVMGVAVLVGLLAAVPAFMRARRAA